MEEVKYKILLVDDEEDNLSLLNRTLRQHYIITKTTSPIEALEFLKNENFDLILSDYKMPGMNGVEFLKASYELCPRAVRLLITAYSDSEILIDAINNGKIYRYIKKPWEASELLMALAGAIEYFLLKEENDKLIQDLKDLFYGTISAIIETLDAKDSYTLGRSRRVTFLSLRMASCLNLSKVDAGKLKLAGLLHDIGMIGISEELLNKTEMLSDSEYEKLKKHVAHGVKILEDIKQLKDVVEIIKYHHEKYDGTGYPYGAKGDEIPLGSRIIAIVDFYESMISDRAYRKGLSHEEAMQKINEQSGTQFDPQIVKAFSEIIPTALNEMKEFERQLAESL